MKLFKKAKKGFTLVELVVVIAVIAILAAVSVGAYFGVTKSAKNSQAEQESKAFHTALLLVVSDPENGYSSDKYGIAIANTFTEADIIDDVKAVTGGEYYVTNANAAEQKYPLVKFTTADTAADTEDQNADHYTTFSYYVDATHFKTISIASGEFVNA